MNIREIGQLKGLTNLNIGFNKFTELPYEMSELSYLITLEIRDNPALTELPPLDNMRSLQTLSIRNVQLSAVPMAVFKISGM